MMNGRTGLTRRWMLAAAAVVSALGGWAGSLADKIHLKDGRVLEGRVQREEKDFVYFVVKIGSLEKVELVVREQIVKIERDADAKTAPAGGATTPQRPDAPARPAEKTAPTTAPREGVKGVQKGEAPAKAADPNATRIAFITLGDPPKDMVGIFMSAGALKESIKMLEDDKPDIVVLWVNSGGGIAVEVQKLSDEIENHIKPKYRTVAWIHSAISAAAMTAITCNEIYFMSKGNFGACTAFQTTGPRQAKAAEGKFLEELLYQMEKISRRGGYDPLIMRAMQVETELSADIDADGVVKWRNDLGGQHIVSDGKGILTFNSQDATKFKFSKGIADTKEELARMLVGDKEWVEVGHDAAEHQVEYREATHVAQLSLNKIQTDLMNAINRASANLQNAAERAKFVGQGRRALAELRSIARRSPGLREYYLPDARLKAIEEVLRKLQAGEPVSPADLSGAGGGDE